MTGMDRETGRRLAGWDHVVQSIQVLLTTPKLSRIMRRAVGSGLPRLVDAPVSPVTLIDFYQATALAIGAYEPRFKVVRVQLDAAAPAGTLSIAIEGIFYPRGHLGDFSVSVPKSASLPL